jgi:ABC-2 type transport system permease protein
MSLLKQIYWGVRREIWEQRAAVGVMVLVASVLALGLAWTLRNGFLVATGETSLAPEARTAISLAFHLMPMRLLGFMLTVVAIAYCLSALRSERQSRSLLLWKSLPVSDWAAVLSKFVAATLVLTAAAWLAAAAMQIVMAVLNFTLLPAWYQFIAQHALQHLGAHLLHAFTFLVVCAIWFAPFYAWALLASTFRYAPPIFWFALPAVTFAVFRYGYDDPQALDAFVQFILGFEASAFRYEFNVQGSPTPPFLAGQFFALPRVWLGLLLTALLLALAVRRRRYSEVS